MRVEVVIYPGGRRREVVISGKDRATVSEVIRRLGFREYFVVAVRCGVPLTEDEVVRDGDLLEIYEVVSTG